MLSAPLRRAQRGSFVAGALSIVSAGALAGAFAAGPLGAQQFLRQSLIVAPFAGTPDARLGTAIAAEMRGRLRRVIDQRELLVIGSDSAARMLRNLGFPRPELASERDVAVVARASRADEMLVGTVTTSGETLELRATLILVRDTRQREPLPVIRARGAEAAADLLTRAVVRARSQMTGLRRCENAARARDGAGAAREATAALRAYPEGVLARICLMRALAVDAASADTVLRLTEQVLARDPSSIIARVLHAQALEDSRRATDAAGEWGRILALRPDSAELSTAAVERLLALGGPRPALEALDSLGPRHGDDVRFPRQRFRALHELERWADAATLGDSLERVDGLFATDPAFAVRYVESLQRRGDTLRAVAKSARSVVEHPQDGRLYVQYLRLIAGENATVLARGLARFPQLADLRVLAAQQARAAGDRAAERRALEQAVAADASLAQSHLRLAEIWFQDGRPDSAVVALARAPRSGSAAATLRAYATGRGVERLRAAQDTVPASYGAARALLSLADSVESREDSRGLLVAVMLQSARSELVVAAGALECDGLKRADALLLDAANLLARGVGSGSAADELVQAQQAMRGAVDVALQRGGCRSS